MLKKAKQKRQLDDLVMQDGDFTTDFFSNFHGALKEFAADALAAEPAPAGVDLRSARAHFWDADDPKEDEEMQAALAGIAKEASHLGEDDFEVDGDATSLRYRSAGPAAEEEEEEDGLEGVERLMVRWVESDWDYFG